MTLDAEKASRRSWATTESGLALAIVIVLAITVLVDSNHNYWWQPKDSAVDILRQTVMLGIFALGSAVVIIAGGIDLSTGSMIAFGGTTCATVMLVCDPDGMQTGQVGAGVMVLGIVSALTVGFLVGSLHAWLITVVELPAFVATLATLVGLRSLGRAVVENVTAEIRGGRSSQIQIFDRDFCYLATSVWIPTLLFLLLAIGLGVLLRHTIVGRHLYALGGNEQAARLSGVRTDRLKWLAYCISAMCASLAGILFIGDQSVADPQTLGRGYELNAIAAAVVGGCSLQGGVGTVSGTILGCLFLRSVIDGTAKIIKTGADVTEGLIVGIVVVLAVAFSQWRAGGQRGKQFFSGALGSLAIVVLGLLAGTLVTLMADKRAGMGAAGAAWVVLVGGKLWEGRAVADRERPTPTVG
ncbi:MAG TPA: ABC transporter permease [Pirellulales bacterium]|jgi:ribose/xylose/arabinose/galactoside ABC-type transport system permease subunit|nr:ABC transporter permease [Pirellulales bacterium]